LVLCQGFKGPALTCSTSKPMNVNHLVQLQLNDGTMWCSSSVLSRSPILYGVISTPTNSPTSTSTIPATFFVDVPVEVFREIYAHMCVDLPVRPQLVGYARSLGLPVEWSERYYDPAELAHNIVWSQHFIMFLEGLVKPTKPLHEEFLSCLIGENLEIPTERATVRPALDHIVQDVKMLLCRFKLGLDDGQVHQAIADFLCFPNPNNYLLLDKLTQRYGFAASLVQTMAMWWHEIFQKQMTIYPY